LPAENVAPSTVQAHTAVAPGIGVSSPVESVQPATAPAARLFIDSPPGSAEWKHSLGERVVWLVNNQQQTAQLRLNPPDLGPVDIRLHLNHDQASIVFHAQHAYVRDAIEDAIPRLREMLQGEGLDLADVDVSQGETQFGQQHAEDPQQQNAGYHGVAEASGPEHAGEQTGVLPGAAGLIDYYA
jgi:flagellar hook-length control protein FliK